MNNDDDINWVAVLAEYMRRCEEGGFKMLDGPLIITSGDLTIDEQDSIFGNLCGVEDEEVSPITDRQGNVVYVDFRRG